MRDSSPLFASRLIVFTLLLGWPLQALDDRVRDIVLASRPRALAGPARMINDRARIVLLPALGLAVLCGPAGRAFAFEAAATLLPVNGAVEGLKWIVDRPRPDGSRDRRNSSFPSSHAANAFAMAAVISRRWRRAAIAAWLLALFVAYSRLYVDRHWFSDVLGSLALAAGGAWLAPKLIARWRSRTTVSNVA